jgi:hypothetical protein
MSPSSMLVRAIFPLAAAGHRSPLSSIVDNRG